MKMINDIVYWFISSGTATALFVFAWKYLKPVMEVKKLHAKTAQEKELLGLVELLADNAVSSLVSSDKSGSQKFLEASDQVQSYLAAHGIHIDMKTIQSAVQAAYEKSPLTPNAISTTNPASLVQKASDFVPDGKAKAIVPKEVA